MRGLSFLGMALSIPCLALLNPILGEMMAPGHPVSLSAKNLSGNSYQFPRQPQEISGFNYHLSRAGREVLSFKGERLRLQNKKLGFFRFALLQEIYVNQGTLIIRQPSQTEETGPNQPQHLSELLAIDSLFSPFPGANISALICQPICITIDQEGREHKATIIAGTARIQPGKQTIRFEGKVELSTGDTVLNTEWLEIDPEDASIVTRSYTVLTGQRKFQGNKLRSNIFLTTFK
ncbi:MAG: LPS export ABC transporter periplasmic protein LptC [Proteobacteria bacterium]|nr:LPS export ABC transporter periplasmic protein LptC [Pseudomonadota bacterium]